MSDQLNAIVRPLVTLMFAMGFVGGFFVGKIGTEAFMSVISMVFGFWFVMRGEEKKNAQTQSQLSPSSDPNK